MRAAPKATIRRVEQPASLRADALGFGLLVEQGVVCPHQHVGQRQRLLGCDEGPAGLAGSDVDVGGLRPQRRDRGVGEGDVGEGVEVEVSHGVAVGDGGDGVVVEGAQVARQALGALGPGGVRVRVVGLDADDVGADQVEQADARSILDEAGEEVLAEHLGGQSPAEAGAGPAVVVLVDVVGTLEQVRDPADRALGQREADVRELMDDTGPQQVRCGVHHGGGLQVQHGGEGRVRGG